MVPMACGGWQTCCQVGRHRQCTSLAGLVCARLHSAVLAIPSGHPKWRICDNLEEVASQCM